MLQIPKNVMQIGEINPHTKIYMEDYVHTFLERSREAEQYLAFGKKEDIGNTTYYMIYGVEKKTDWDRGSFPYFKKYERIGTVEGSREKREFRPVRGSAMRLDGYFVFYEQNEDMQSYMITVREAEGEDGKEEKEEVIKAVQQHREQQREKQEETVQTQRPVYRRDADGTRALRRAALQKSQRRTGIRAKRRSLPEYSRGEGRKQSITLPGLCRAGSMILLLVLVITGLTSLNRYPDMKAVTTLFREAAVAVRGEEAAVQEAVVPDAEVPELAAPDAGSMPEEGGLIVEEATRPQTEAVTETEAATETEPASYAADPALKTASVSEKEPAPDTEPASALETEAASEMAQAIARPVTYIVKEGDSLAGIMKNHYGSTDRIEEICSLNEIRNPDQIQPGQNILLP